MVYSSIVKHWLRFFFSYVFGGREHNLFLAFFEKQTRVKVRAMQTLGYTVHVIRLYVYITIHILYYACRLLGLATTHTHNSAHLSAFYIVHSDKNAFITSHTHTHTTQNCEGSFFSFFFFFF